MLHGAFYCVSCLFSGSLPATGADRAGGCFTRRQDQLVSRYELLKKGLFPGTLLVTGAGSLRKYYYYYITRHEHKLALWWLVVAIV